ncbi:3-oxo-tetronate 4-phosphate decarboxylase [uncultured Hoeflea sp.]|uniref:3-oxo-tetronate 4-phosphate decarboxylase n=1 Tax=uncultured Hoeflea sp. TaxID=538666 RepID=UPI0030EEB971|tara:strand:- start:5333 stop:5977 length:645 start_codon:yes stop_codon:yes gene_type:complete
MSEETTARDGIARWAKSMFDRGLTNGSSGNISVRLSDGRLLVTPTGSSMGFIDPGRMSLIDPSGKLLSGDAPTKEIPLHSAFYETRHGAGAVVHLHSCHSVVLSVLPETDPDDVIPPITAYSVMKLGRVKLLPYFMPGDPAMGDAVRGLLGKRSAVLLANHGPVVCGKDLDAAVYAMEELEEAAKLTLLCRGLSPKLLSQAEVSHLVEKFDVSW